jgi:hypothetical protein
MMREEQHQQRKNNNTNAKRRRKTTHKTFEKNQTKHLKKKCVVSFYN